MSDEDVKLLEAVRDWRPPEKLHPLAMFAWQQYEEHGNGLPDEALGNIRHALNGYGDDLVGLAEALEGVTRFMIYVGEHVGDREAGQRITDLMREYTHRFEPFWERVAEALDNVGEDTRGTFTSFLTGSVDKKTAPTFGEKAPEGSVAIKDLAPPGRPPPWAPKKKPR